MRAGEHVRPRIRTRLRGGHEHDRREQDDGRVEAEHDRDDRRDGEHEREQTPRRSRGARIARSDPIASNSPSRRHPSASTSSAARKQTVEPRPEIAPRAAETLVAPTATRISAPAVRRHRLGQQSRAGHGCGERHPERDEREDQGGRLRHVAITP